MPADEIRGAEAARDERRGLPYSYGTLPVGRNGERTHMQLRFQTKNIQYWAKRYTVPQHEEDLMDLRPAVQQAGRLTKAQLGDVCRWKSPRSAGHVRSNSPEYVEAVTSFSLATTCERARLESLIVLDGVQWPTATAILHLFHRAPYPILDFRALWSVGVDVPKQYSFDFWWKYVEFCRRVSKEAKVCMRVLDRALWQYSKEKQPPNSG